MIDIDFDNFEQLYYCKKCSASFTLAGIDKHAREHVRDLIRKNSPDTLLPLIGEKKNSIPWEVDEEASKRFLANLST